MHRHHHLFERIATLENLIAAGKAALRGKRLRPPGCQFFGDFEKEVFALHDELWAGSYHHGGLGVDFAWYVVFADGRIRIRSSSVRRFDRRYKKMLWDLRRRRTRAATITQSVRAWVAHASHAQSERLRRSVLSGR